LKKFLLHFLQYTLFLGLGGVLLYLSFRSIGFDQLLVKLESAKYQYVGLSLLAGYAGFYLRAYRWNLMIEPLGYKTSLGNTYHAITIGYMANYAFPRIGEVTRCGILNRTDKIPADALIGTVIAERIIDVICLLILTVLVVLMKLSLFGHFFYDKIFQPIYLKFAGIFNFSYSVWLIILIAILLIFFTIYAFREQILKIALVRKIGSMGKGVVNGLKSVFSIKKRWQFIVSTLLIWASYLMATYIIFISLSSTSQLGLVDALFVLIAGSYGMAAPVQAGIGAYHGIVALALSVYAISWGDGLAFALLSHGSQSVGIILLGAISMLILFFRNRKLKKNSSINKEELNLK
jgi:uncharacterized protein (TIRG00374 family)